nr:MAG TPA: hypothetical protein [Caudoviricetes sp.]
MFLHFTNPYFKRHPLSLYSVALSLVQKHKKPLTFRYRM